MLVILEIASLCRLELRKAKREGEFYEPRIGKKEAGDFLAK